MYGIQNITVLCNIVYVIIDGKKLSTSGESDYDREKPLSRVERLIDLTYLKRPCVYIEIDVCRINIIHLF